MFFNIDLLFNSFEKCGQSFVFCSNGKVAVQISVYFGLFTSESWFTLTGVRTANNTLDSLGRFPPPISFG
jgi:hypothetical protein